MFKRRIPKPLTAKIRDSVWPRIGLKRYIKYIYFRLKRQKGSPHNFAVGLSIGTGVAFLPFYGMHFIFVFLLCGLFKGNVFAGIVASFLSNPITFPLIFALDTILGNIVLGRASIQSIVHFFSADAVPPQVIEFNFNEMLGHFFWDTFVPASIGGSILCLAISVVLYPIILFILKKSHITEIGKQVKS